MTPDTARLARDLLDGVYGRMFVYPMQDATVAAIWDREGNPALLEALVDDPAAPAQARFLAAEILFARDPAFLLRIDRRALAAVYAEALVHDYTGMANSWGLLYQFDDPGVVGAHYVQLDDDALPSLIGLLDDETIALTYAGSEEATVGNKARYRVKDFAAFYISKITGIPLLFEQEPRERDRAIARLVASLPH